jgi:type I restriction enzyme S subunit
MTELFPCEPLGELAISVSDTHPMSKYRLIFLNTSDIYGGKLLHKDYTEVAYWPGQAKKSVALNDILFSEIRPANGRWALIKEPAEDIVVSTKLMVIRSDPAKLLAEFLYLFVTSDNITGWLQHLAESRSGTFPQITFDQVASLQIPLPPLPEQRRISHVLGTFDGRIENNRKTAKTLEAMAQAIFKSWFVDFDPVRAKMNGEAGESICKRLKLTPEILDLFPDRLVASELGEIPEGWGNVPFSECVTIIGGGTPKTSVLEYWDGNIPWFSIVDAPINDGIWVVDTEKKISELGLNNSSTRILPIGTTIITARGTVGRVALVGVPMAINQSCYGLRGKYDERGFFTNFSTRLIIQELRQHAHGSVFDTITRDTIESIEVTFPPIGIIGWFENAISSPMEKLKQYNEETHSITMLRDTLLPKLISGEIRVPEAELQIEETTG